MAQTKKSELLTNPINLNNPITVQVLGICSALAVTVKLEPAIVMAISVTVVTALANLIISLIRNTIPSRIRIIVQLVVVSFLVILVDQVLKAFMYDLDKALSVYVGLIITNCIVMGRLEAFALGNKPFPALLDSIGSGAGYGVILIVVAFIREFFGSGTLFDHQILPDSIYIENGGFYSNCGFMLNPPMALILIGIVIWIQRAKVKELQEK